MEICSNLYRSLEALQIYSTKTKLLRLAVNRNTLLKISTESGTDDVLAMGYAKGVQYLEEKLKMEGLIGKPSLSLGSPFHNMPMDLRLLSGEEEDGVLCILQEYPFCCGAAIVSNFRVEKGVLSEIETIDMFVKFMDIVYDILGIMNYSMASFILSSRDNELLYNHIDKIKEACADSSYAFVNDKTEARCTLIIKKV